MSSEVFLTLMGEIVEKSPEDVPEQIAAEFEPPVDAETDGEDETIKDYISTCSRLSTQLEVI